MTTLSDLVEETRAHLGSPETLNQIAACDAVTTSVTLQRDLRNVQPGTLLSVGLETMYVWTVTDPTSRVLEVRRGHGGSTAATHASGDLVRIAPDHPDAAIVRALNHELDALTGAGLYAVKTLDLTTSSASARTYDLAADVQRVLDVRVDVASTGNEWPEVKSWTWLPNMPTTEFTSGAALRLDSAVPSGRPMRVFYAAPFTHLATLADDVLAVSGLPGSAHDIPPIGAAWRLVAPTEVERNQTTRQGDSRRAQEVQAGAKLRAPLGLQQVRSVRVAEEKARQLRAWPPRSTR